MLLKGSQFSVGGTKFNMRFITCLTLLLSFVVSISTNMTTTMTPTNEAPTTTMPETQTECIQQCHNNNECPISSLCVQRGCSFVCRNQGELIGVGPSSNVKAG